MSDVLVLDMGAVIKGNCTIDEPTLKDKVIVLSYSHGVSLPHAGDRANAERTAGRPSFSEISFTKMCDLSTTEMYKACTQGTKIGNAILHVGRVENGKYMPFFKYEMTNAMITSINTSGGGGLPSDSFTIGFTALKCDYTKQKSDSTQAGTGTWNWNLETMKSV
jgi:type VI secretion system secreted protein Hcp